MKIFYHPRFKKSYQRLPLSVQRKAERREAMFRKNPFNPGLDAHKLRGKLKDQWSFSIDWHNRIIFEFDGGDVTFLDIGPHDIYKKG